MRTGLRFIVTQNETQKLKQQPKIPNRQPEIAPADAQELDSACRLPRTLVQRNHHGFLVFFVKDLILLGEVGSHGPRSAVVELMLLGVEDGV